LRNVDLIFKFEAFCTFLIFLRKEKVTSKGQHG